MTGTTHFTVGFDDETVDLLMDLAEETRCPPAMLISSIVRDVLRDDAAAHGAEAAPIPKQMLN
jgi:predicted transcriptional regulator